MAYRVINKFRDTEDNNRLYREGDEFPKGDSQPSQERIEVLSGIHPKYNKAFIEVVETKGTSEEEEKEAVKAELEAFGVSFHPNTGLEKLKDKLAEAKAGQEKKE